MSQLERSMSPYDTWCSREVVKTLSCAIDPDGHPYGGAKTVERINKRAHSQCWIFASSAWAQITTDIPVTAFELQAVGNSADQKKKREKKVTLHGQNSALAFS